MEKVAVALSGGVDSTTAALMLKRSGYEPVGITYKLPYQNEKDIEDAKASCEALKIKHMVFDYRDIFTQKVMHPFIDCYLKAETPNPCIFCNKEIKFGRFLKDAEDLGCNFVSTGHYARIKKDENGFHLLKSFNLRKDQSYVLYNLNSSIMSKLLLPLGEVKCSKDKLRETLKEEGLPIFNRPESQDICFIKGESYSDFIEEHASFLPGEGHFVDESGKILGTHKGFYRCTVGQRKGLGIALGSPAYVVDVDAKTGNVVLSQDESRLFSKEFNVRNYNFCRKDIKTPFKAKVKTRYRSKEISCTIYEEGSILKVMLDEPCRAVTKGQSAVFYAEDEVIGGGIISEIFK